MRYILYDSKKSRKQLISELQELRNQVSNLKRSSQYLSGKTASLSDEQFFSLVENSHDMIFCIDRSGMYHMAGGRRLKDFGLTPADILNRTIFDLFPPDVAKKGHEKHLEVFKSGEAVTFEQAFEFDGMTKTDLTTLYPVKNSEGKVEFVGIICHDITGQKNIENELNHERTFLNNIIDRNPFSISLYDTDGHFVRGNKAYFDIFGGPPSRDYSLFDDPILLKLGLDADIESLKNGEVFETSGITYNVHEIDPDLPDKPLFIRGLGFPIMDDDGNIELIVVMLEDITDWYNTDKALHESERRYRHISENASDMVFRLRLKPSLGFEFVSPACENLTGYTPQDHYDDPEIVFKIVHPDDRHILEYHLQSPDGMEKPFETRWIIKNGDVIWTEQQNIPVFNDAGEYVAIDGIARDITERKQAEQVLQNHKNRLLQIIDVSSISTFIIDKDHVVTHWNKACEKLTGIPAEEMVGKSDQWKPFYPTKRPVMADLIVDGASQEEISSLYDGKYRKSAPTHKSYEAEDYFPNLGGRGTWLFFTASPLKDDNGNITGAMETLQDITERNLAGNALKEQLIFLKTLIDTIPNPIFYKDANRLFIGCNKAYSDYIGVSQEDIIGKNVFDVYQGDIAHEFDTMDRSILHRGGVQIYELTINHVDGSVKDVIVNNAVFAKSDGSTAGIVGVIIDITDRKKLEAQLSQAQKLEAIGTLAAGIAHDFNNILGTILMNTELALLELPQDHERREELNQVIKSTYRAKDLVTQILTFSRQTKLEIKPIQIAFVIKEALRMLGASIPSTVEIVQNIDMECGYIKGDPVQIHQIVLNLCNNAAYAMRAKGGVLDVSLERVTINETNKARPQELRNGTYVLLSVRDTGPGIEKSIEDKIFNPFFTTKAPGSGSGLGLSVVHGIVQSYQGAITFESNPVNGTVFRVYFPLVQAVSVTEKTDLKETVSGYNETVLLVDDEEELVGVISKLLQGHGYSVVTTTSSLEALEIFRASPESFDIVITDLTMPKMRGTELSKEIKAIRPDIPIVLCTGFNEGVSIESVRPWGIQDVLKKPFSGNDIAEIIHDVLSGR